MPYSEEQLAKLREEDKKRQKAGKPPVNMSTIPVEGKRPDHGKPRPQRVAIEPIPVGFKVALKDSPAPIRYFNAIKETASEPCCKELDNLTVQYYKTSPELEDRDMVIIECTVCGRKHRRGAHGTAGLGA